MMEFTINEYLKVKLENEKIMIYVADRPFQQCTFLLLNIPIEEIQSFDEIESIDEASEKLDRTMEGGKEKLNIPPEVEFWGHCSNLQVWAENNYNTRLLHSNLAFPLLKKLADAKDPIANRVFKNEVAERFSSGHKPVMTYLLNRGYLDYFNEQELEALFEEFKESPEILLGATPKLSKLALNVLVKKHEATFVISKEQEVIEEVELQKLYKNETGTFAIWRGKTTKGYLDWKIRRDKQIIPFQFIKNLIERLPEPTRAEKLYSIGKNIAHIRLTPEYYDSEVYIDKSEDSNAELGIPLIELAVEYPTCPENAIDYLISYYGAIKSYEKLINLVEKADKQDEIKPSHITGIFFAAFKSGRQEIVNKYLGLTLNHKIDLEKPDMLSNIIYALNRKETKEASEIALILTANYWEKFKANREMKSLPSLWVNITDAFIVADKINKTFEEIVADILDNLEEMHPIIYENLAWYFLKNADIDKAIYYLNEAKEKGHPGFVDIEDSKYFKALADHPEFRKLFFKSA